MNSAEYNQDFVKVAALLVQCTEALSHWLDETLLRLGGDCWRNLVLPALSRQQFDRVQREGLSKLDQLDLAALLRILDQKWYPISNARNIPKTGRETVKSLKSIRNRWAHLDAHGVAHAEAFEDLGTIRDFLRLIDAPKDLINEASAARESILRAKAHKVKENEARPVEELLQVAPKFSGEDAAAIVPGSLVRLKTDHSVTGAMMAMDGTAPSSRCTVFADNKPRQFYLSQIELVPQTDEREFVHLNTLHSVLTGIQVRHPSVHTLYSLNAARIDFVPYQFRPALKLIQSDQPRLLIADGVGVGKTIEAGLILRELQARMELQSVLIICPRPLVAERKWELEMKRFDEQFSHLDGRALRFCINETDLEGEWPQKYEKAIVPYSLLDEKLLYGSSGRRGKKRGLLELDSPPKFDLVIVDEAHHVRNSLTYSHQAVKFFCEGAQAVVFLTATPVQMGNRDLFVLLNLLRPDLVIDETTYDSMSKPNLYINQAAKSARSGGESWQSEAQEALHEAATTTWGSAILPADPTYQELCRKLPGPPLPREERVKTISQIERLHSFAHLINRTRRRDIEEFCVRRPATHEVSFTRAQKDLHDAVLDFECRALTAKHGARNVPFMMTTIRRQASSCIFGLAPLITDILSRRLCDLDYLEMADADSSEASFLDGFREEAKAIADVAKSLPEEDPKFEEFLSAVSQKLSQDRNKVMVFSSFIHTLKYLHQGLLNEGVRVGMVYGATPDEERLLLRNRFSLPKEDGTAIDVLLFSEVGCEGLDYQFCDMLINYDLPWNPMRIEQRIGRIDRRGQQSDVVTICNFITKGTIDAAIYNRCLLRIGVFEASIGDCEEILGELHQAIQDIVTSPELTDEEREGRLEQLADNEVRQIEEARRLEDREHELFGLSIPKNQQDSELGQYDSYWLMPTRLESFVANYLKERTGAISPLLGEGDLKTLRLSQDARNMLLADFKKLERRRSIMWRSWEKWLKGSEQHAVVTFDSSCASAHREAMFFMPLHPIVLQAAHFVDKPEPIYTAMTVEKGNVSPGTYPFAVYAWEYKGLRPELRLLPVCSSEEVQEEFFDIVESSRPVQETSILPDQKVFDALDADHHALWGKNRQEHAEKSARICAFRKQSLTTSHQGRLNVIRQQLQESTNDKIHRMRQAELDNAQADFERRMAEVEKAEKAADIHTRAVVFGVLKIGSKSE